MNSVQKYWSIFWRLRLMHLMLMFEYRADFLFWVCVSAMWTGFNFFFAHILVSTTGHIADWNENQLFVLMSIFTIFDAFTWSFFYYNMRRYTEKVFSGELDAFLVKPIDTQFLLSVEHNSYNNLIRLLIGIIMLIRSLLSLTPQPNVFQIVMGTVFLFGGFIILYSIWFTIATISFWVERINNINDIFPSLRRLSQMPREIYSGMWSLVFCMVIPVVLITGIPAEIFTGKYSMRWIIYFLLFMMISPVISRLFFHFSLRKYASAGS